VSQANKCALHSGHTHTHTHTHMPGEVRLVLLTLLAFPCAHKAQNLLNQKTFWH